MQRDPRVAQVLHPQDGREDILRVLVEHQHLPHRRASGNWRFRHLLPACGEGATWIFNGVVEIEEGQQCAGLRLLQGARTRCCLWSVHELCEAVIDEVAHTCLNGVLAMANDDH